MREVALVEFASAHAAGATVIDVREPAEYLAGHVPGARSVPLGRLPHTRVDAAAGEPVYLICATGNRSRAAAEFLGRQGITAYSVAGGTGAWRSAGRRIVCGAHEDNV
jgi:rhodanese-related sulfurtransferase